MKDYYISMFQYEQWANQQIVNILQPNDSININLMFHLESAKHIWLSRIENFKRTLRVFEDADIEKLIFWQNKNTQDMNHFLEKLTQQKLDQMISYFNSERKTFENSVSDIIIQLIHHSCYHRGQVAKNLVINCQKPAITDYIHFKRTL